MRTALLLLLNRLNRVDLLIATKIVQLVHISLLTLLICLLLHKFIPINVGETVHPFEILFSLQLFQLFFSTFFAQSQESKCVLDNLSFYLGVEFRVGGETWGLIDF